MKHLLPVLLVPAAIALFAASDQPWKDKKIAEWNEEDAKIIVSDSPWAKTAYPIIKEGSQQRGMNNGRGQQGGQGRNRGGLNIPGLNIPIGGGGGGGGRGGGGYPQGGNGGNYPQGGSNDPQNSRRFPQGDPNDPNNPNNTNRRDDEDRPQRSKNSDPQTLTLRWASAKPVQDAELKLKDVDAPTMDAGHYGIVIYGLPTKYLNADKPKAELKKDGKTVIKQSDFKLFRRDSGNMFVFYFPRSKEISLKDKRVEFHAILGGMEIKESFYVSDMMIDGKLEL
jgi:hypothetical protein